MQKDKKKTVFNESFYWKGQRFIYFIAFPILTFAAALTQGSFGFLAYGNFFFFLYVSMFYYFPNVFFLLFVNSFLYGCFSRLNIYIRSFLPLFIISLYFFSVFGVNDEIEMNWIHFDQANILRFTVPQFLLILTVLFFLNLKAGRIEKLGQEEKNS
ncbi:MAG TPA: hypothetical protein PL048_12405 [Leptospiraceae bacterium]|nr:hypothetical protein [Leptospiraceae bacterium]HNI26655.1 hypothetical protein [Leptospiraceae bacterium]